MDIKDISPQIAQVAEHYQLHKPPEAWIFVQHLLSWLVRLIKDLLSSFHVVIPGLADSRYAGNVLQVLLYLCGIAASCALAAAIIVRIRQLRKKNRQPAQGGLFSAVPLDSHSWRQQAEALALKGNYAAACRAAYMALIKVLDEHQVANFVAARTNYEYWQSLGDYPDIRRRFKETFLIVEGAWFGGNAATSEDYNRCLENLLAVTAQVEKRAGSPA